MHPDSRQAIALEQEIFACPNFFSLWLQYFGLFDNESSVLEFLVEVWRTRSSLLLVFLFVVEGLGGGYLQGSFV